MGALIHRIIFVMFLSVICSQIVLAQVPDYSVNIDLKSKSVEKDESTLFVLHIRGSGSCDYAVVKVDTDGFIVFEDDAYLLLRINESDPVLKYLEQVSVEYGIIDNQVIFYNRTTSESELGSFAVIIEDLTQNEFYDLELQGNLIVQPKAQAGEYNTRATFFCSNDGNWYSFYDEDKFKVFLKWERIQFVSAFVFSFLAIIISLLAVVIAVFPEDARKKIFKRLKQLWKK